MPNVPSACVRSLVACLCASSAWADAPEHLSIFLPKDQAITSSDRTLAGYDYDPATGRFWTSTFGASGAVLRVTPGSSPERYAFPSDLLNVIKATDIPGGATNADYGGTVSLFNLTLNPAALTIDYGSEADADGNPIGTITYQPGQLAFLTNYGSTVRDISGEYRPEFTKRILRYDLRAIGQTDPNGVGNPDRDNADNGVGDTIGAYNQVDWNDVFGVVASDHDFRDEAGHDPASKDGAQLGSNPVWSTDGQSMYVVDTRDVTGGLYKVDPVNDGVVRLLADETSSNLSGDPGVMHTSVRNFGGSAAVGDQILIEGTTATGNVGGINYILDDASPDVTDSFTPQALLTSADIQELTGEAGSPESIVTDAGGNVYFYDSGSNGLLRYDSHGRMVSVVNEIQLTSLNQSATGDPNGYEVGGGILRMNFVEGTSGETDSIIFRSNNEFVARLDLGGVTGDFDNDRQITADDTAFFIQQFNKPGFLAPTDADYLDYAKADLNSSGQTRGSVAKNDPRNYDGTLLNRAVDHKDLDALRQFINLKAGDTDWDFKVDLDDYVTLRNNFDPTAGDKSFFQGNFNYQTDGVVDLDDYVALRNSFNPGQEYEADALLAGSVSMLAATALAPAAGELSLRINADGSAELLGNAVTFDGFQIVGTDDSIVEADFADLDGLMELVGANYVAALTASPSDPGITLSGLIALGRIYNNTGLNASDLTFKYSSNGQSIVGVVDFVPEPTTLALLAAGGMLAVSRRRTA